MSRPPGDEVATADISEDGRYRYLLERRWVRDRPIALWVMLNPSTADATDDDQTIRQVRAFTKRAGLGGFAVVNLFAYRATNPADLKAVQDPVGPRNMETLAKALAFEPAELVIVAWGDRPKRLRAYAPPFTLMAEAAGVALHCLGRTGKGGPRHPSRLAHDTPLEVYAR